MGSQRAAIYARVSSAKQRDAHSVESQLLVLRRFVEAQGWTLTGEYVDDGRSAKSGMLEKREAFTQLVAAIGTFDVLVVLDVNRLTRTDDMRERAEILGPFQAAGIDIVTPSGGRQDLRSLMGELYVTMQAMFAAEENRKRSIAITAGKQRAIAEGRKPAGPTPYGLKYTRATGTWSVDAVRGPIVVEIFRRVIAGESCLVIADDLRRRGIPCPRNKWDRHAVWRVVRSRHAVGEWTADKRKRITLAVPSIIDESTWQHAQSKLIAHGKRGLVKTKHTYLLEGMATCAACGSPIAIRSATFVKRRGYANPAAYVCRARKLARLDDPRCEAPIVQIADTDDLVWEQIAATINSRDLASGLQRLVDQQAANRQSWEADVKEYRAKLEKLKEREAAVLARYQRGMISDDAFDTSLASYRRERAALETQIKTAEGQAAGGADVPMVDVSRWLRELRTLARTASLSERQRIVRMLVRPGSVKLDKGVVRLTMLVEAGATVEDSPDLLVVGSG
jgi:site-specific DNA recombinase